MTRSMAVYDVLAAAVRGVRPDARRLRQAYEAPLALWTRILAFEDCASFLDRQMRGSGLGGSLPPPVRDLIRGSASRSLRRGLLAYRQLSEVAAVAAAHGVRLLALKGAAQLLGEQLPGARSMADIDLLVPPVDGRRLHEALMRELGYASTGPAYPHHLPALRRDGSLGIDVHVRLGEAPTPLDDMIWQRTRVAMVEGHPIELPSSTGTMLHTLEHCLGLDWMSRYRLRDVVDVAARYDPAVADDVVRHHVARSAMRAACETLLSAAHDLEPRVPRYRDDAWGTIRRVSHARLFLAAAAPSSRLAGRAYRYGGVAAEGSPRSLVRASRSAGRWLRGTLGMVSRET